MTPIFYPTMFRLSRRLFRLLVGRQRDDQRIDAAAHGGSFFLEQFDGGGLVCKLCLEGCI